MRQQITNRIIFDNVAKLENQATDPIFLFTRLPDRGTMESVVVLSCTHHPRRSAPHCHRITAMDQTPDHTLSAAQAIQAALEAETAATQAIAACQQQAEQLLDEARRRASEMASQADARISELHKEYNKRIRKQEESAQENARRQRSSLSDLPDTTLDAAVARMAAWLTGAAPPPTPTESANP